GSRLLVVLTCRDEEPHHEHIVTQTLALVARGPGNQTVPLQGFTDRDVARFLELTIGQSASAALVSAVYKETEGNPFFVTEVVRLLATESDDCAIRDPQAAITLVIPQSVRSVIERRLSHLSGECRALLTVPSVIGREFNWEVLRRVVGADLRLPPLKDQELDRLEAAGAARLLTLVPHTIGPATVAP